MRLVCPNCGAQYEVPDEVIPAAGRDVQCSNCGHTWFQAHPDEDRELEADLGRAVRDEEWTPPPPAEPEDMPAASEPSREPEPEPEPVREDETDAPVAHDPGPEPEPDRAPERRRLDPEVADVLRQEAEQEARARAAEGDPLESQPDLGLSEPEELDEHEKRAREARDRMARMRGEPVGVAAASAAAAGSRRDLLPDIDEINSTLRSTSERRTPSAVEEAEREVAPPEPRRRGGFRRGFLLMILLFAIATLVYVYAPQISEMVPQVTDYLDAYVVWVDGLRASLNEWVAQGLAWLDSMASSAGGA